MSPRRLTTAPLYDWMGARVEQGLQLPQD